MSIFFNQKSKFFLLLSPCQPAFALHKMSMERRLAMPKVEIILESFTETMKAKRSLLSLKIPITIIKNTIDQNIGCQYGIEIYEKDLLTAAHELRQNGLRYTVYRK